MNIYLFTNFSSVVCGNRPMFGAGERTPTKSIEIVGATWPRPRPLSG